MKPHKKVVAEKLRRYREACALSQKQVADALSMERSTYTKYETGACEPGLYTLVRLAAIFNVTPLLLLPTEGVELRAVSRIKDAGNSDSPIYQLAKDERGLVAAYRVLDKESKAEAAQLIANLSKKDT